MPGLVRVSVATAPGSVLDVAVPGHLVVADVIPELLRLGARGGDPRLVTAAGRLLAPDATLPDQGVGDGAVLALVDREDAAPVVEDPAEQVALDVQAEVLAWDLRLLRPVGLVVSVLLLGLAGAALAHGPAWSGAVAAAASVMLLGGAAWAARHRDRLLATGAAWLAVGFAAVAGTQASGPAAAGAAGAATAAVAWRSLGDAGRLVLPAAVASTTLGVLALLAQLGRLDPGLVASAALAAVGLALPALPRLALALAAGRPAPARELLRASLVAATVLLLVLTALAATSVWGATLAAVVGLLAACRGTRHHGAIEVALGIATAVGVLIVAGAALTVQRPEVAALVGLVALAAGAAATGVALLPASVRADPRLAIALDRLETLLLVSLAPLVVLASGVPRLVAGLLPQ